MKKKMVFILVASILMVIGGYLILSSIKIGSGKFPLKKGDSGPVIEKLQNKINKRGYGLTADGNFGFQTEQAVIQMLGKPVVSWLDYKLM